MKKVIAGVLCILMLAICCSCGDNTAKTTTTETVSEGKLNLGVLQNLNTKEEFAKLLGVSDISDMEQLLVYIKLFYDHLPYEDEKADLTTIGTTDDGYKCLTIEQARSLVTPIILTKDNWKEYITTGTEEVNYSYYDESDNEIEVNEIEGKIGFKEGYNPLYYDFNFVIYNKANDNTSNFSGGYWPENVTDEDGKLFINSYDEEKGDIKKEFNIDNYSCSFAQGVIYTYDIDSSLVYVEKMNEETYERTYVPIDEADFEYNDNDRCFVIQYGETNEEITIVGYEGLGSYIFEDDEVIASLNRDIEVKINPVDKITLEVLSSCKTKEELASKLGVTNTKDMNQLLVYMNNYYYTLPSEKDIKDPVTSYGITSEGYNYLTVSEAKTLVTPYVITTENWKEFIEPTMEEIESYSYDESDNEVMEIIKEPSIDIKSEYMSSWRDVNLTLVNNNTNSEFVFDGRWNEDIYLEDGKYFVKSYDEHGYGQSVEFNLDDYSCIFADGMVYKYDLDHKLLYVDYYNEEKEEWITENIDDYTGEDNNSSIVIIQYGKTNSDVCFVGYSGLGSFVYFESFLWEKTAN